MSNQNNESSKPVCIRLTNAEVEAVRNITKVDAVAPAVVSIVRKAIEKRKTAEERKTT